MWNPQFSDWNSRRIYIRISFKLCQLKEKYTTLVETLELISTRKPYSANICISYFCAARAQLWTYASSLLSFLDTHIPGKTRPEQWPNWSQMPLLTQQTREMNIHALSGIRTHDPCSQVSQTARPPGSTFPLLVRNKTWQTAGIKREG
jgi:hypothetical protein